MDLDSVTSIPEIILYATGFGLIYWLLYGRYIFSIIDPLFFNIFNASFAGILVIRVVEEPVYIIHYFICQLCLWGGFMTVQQYYRNPIVKAPIGNQFFFTDYSLLRSIVYVLWFIYIVANIFLLYTKGFALFADDTSHAKVANFQDGFGLIRKINWAVGGVAATGLTFLWLENRRWQDIILLLAIISSTAFDGSKAALVKFVLCYGVFVYHPYFRRNKEILSQLKRLMPIAFICVFGVIFTILIRESNNIEGALMAFLGRLLLNADSVLYYYLPANQTYFATYTISDFPAHLINPILGFLRLAPYQEAIGNIMVENSVPPSLIASGVVIGPNTPFYIEGQIYFGYFGAFIYSFLLGSIQSWFRATYFSLTHSSAFFFICFNLICIFSTSIWGEVTLFIGQFFDVIILVFPVYIIVSLAIKRKLVFKRVKFARS